MVHQKMVHFFSSHLLHSVLPSFSFCCSLPFIWSESAGLLCFPESHLRSCWHLEGRKWQGSWQQWNSKLNHSYYLSLSGKCRPLGVYISGFCPWNFLSPREAELGSKACKENGHRFCLCFVESDSWMEPGDSVKFLVNREAAAWGPRFSEN